MMDKDEIIIQTLENENQLLKQNIKKEIKKNEALITEIDGLKNENEKLKEITNKEWEEKQMLENRLNRITNSRSYKIYKILFRR